MLLDLSPELICEILKYTAVRERGNLLFTCKKIHQILIKYDFLPLNIIKVVFPEPNKSHSDLSRVHVGSDFKIPHLNLSAESLPLSM